jgi:hypothetical protein
MALEAARALLDAGRQAMRLSAHGRALEQFDHGLALLANAPPSPERKEIQRQLQVARLGPQRNLAGPASAGFGGALDQATEGGQATRRGGPS